jgi:hypothetical protein
MTTEWVSAVASTVGTLVAAIGLFVIVRTLQHSQKQNENSIYQLITSRMASITETFLEYPELRPYFYGSQNLQKPSSSDQLMHCRVQAMCEMLFDHAEVVLTQPSIMGDLGRSYEGYFRDLVTHSPALKNYWRKRRNWYIHDLQKIFDPIVGLEGVETDPEQSFKGPS